MSLSWVFIQPRGDGEEGLEVLLELREAGMQGKSGFSHGEIQEWSCSWICRCQGELFFQGFAAPFSIIPFLFNFLVFF